MNVLHELDKPHPLRRGWLNNKQMSPQPLWSCKMPALTGKRLPIRLHCRSRVNNIISIFIIDIIDIWREVAPAHCKHTEKMSWRCSPKRTACLRWLLARINDSSIRWGNASPASFNMLRHSSTLFITSHSKAPPPIWSMGTGSILNSASGATTWVEYFTWYSFSPCKWTGHKSTLGCTCKGWDNKSSVAAATMLSPACVKARSALEQGNRFFTDQTISSGRAYYQRYLLQREGHWEVWWKNLGWIR